MDAFFPINIFATLGDLPFPHHVRSVFEEPIVDVVGYLFKFSFICLSFIYVGTTRGYLASTIFFFGGWTPGFVDEVTVPDGIVCQ